MHSWKLAYICNLRPISLLESTYKITTKVLLNQMMDGMPQWICPLQVVFVKGQSIFDNVLVAYESLDWAVISNQDLFLVLLDFKKTNDRVSCFVRWSRTFPFGLQSTMDTMGDGIVQWINNNSNNQQQARFHFQALGVCVPRMHPSTILLHSFGWSPGLHAR